MPNLDGFKRIEIVSRHGVSTSKKISITKSGKQFLFSKSICQECGFKDGDRVDLYRNGKMFAISKSNVGCLTLRKSSPKSTTSSLIIRSTGMWGEVVPFLKNGADTKLNIVCDNGTVFFSAKEEE